MYSFAAFKRALKRRPDQTFGATMEEVVKKRMEKMTPEKRAGAVEKRKKTNIERYGVDCASKVKKFTEKTKQTNLERYGFTYPAGNEAIRNKIKSTNLERYGSESASSTKEYKEKVAKTMIERYGDNPYNNSIIKDKRKNTNIERYGVNTPTKLEAVKDKIKNTLKDRYGFQSDNEKTDVQLESAEAVKQKRFDTNLERYGVNSISQLPETKEKQLKTKKDNGQIILVDGKSLKEIAKEKNVAYTTIQGLYLKTKDGELVSNYSLKKTSIEAVVEKMLKRCGVDFVYSRQMPGQICKPDFLIEEKKLIIECNGLYWHSEMIIEEKKHHYDRRNKYKSLGYTSLFFNEDEILKKPLIVESVIRNKLGLNSTKIGARKCTIEEIKDKSFLEKNHLMGAGSGRIFALKFGGEIVAAIQVKWKNKATQTLDISRFCTKPDVSVQGGFSRLLNHCIKIYKPKIVENFIDQRYGEGAHLESLGFKQETCSVSFRWTNLKETFHRMTFKSNSGYESGFTKIWDCGQAKWIKIIGDENVYS